MFLLDTSIVSELRKPRPNGAVLAWYQPIPPSDLAVPAIVIGEMALAMERLRASDPRGATELERWLDKMSGEFPILPANAPILRLWARLMARAQPHLSTDALIAATALHHELTVATRNVRDFTWFGVLVANPFGRTR